jgi:hypothetical protein
MSSDHITTLHVKGFISNTKAYGCHIHDDHRLLATRPDDVASLATFYE